MNILATAADPETSMMSTPRRHKDHPEAEDTPDSAIYRRIYRAVLAQQLPPGSRLPEMSLSEIFGVGRSIVRKALARLAADRIITHRPNQGAMVAQPSLEETRDIFHARRLIEADVAALLAGRLATPDQEALAALLHEEAEAHGAGRHEHRVELSMAFHLRLARLCPNRVLGEMLETLVVRTSIVIALYKTPDMDACYSGGDHEALLRALQDGAGQHAADLTREHLEALEQRLSLNQPNPPVDLASVLLGTPEFVD